MGYFNDPNCLHCGACGVPLNDTAEFEQHIKTIAHLNNVMKFCDNQLKDGHAQIYIKKMLEKIKTKEPIEPSHYAIIYMMKSQCELLLQLRQLTESES